MAEAVAVVATLHLVVWMFTAGFVGGTSHGGKIENGRYFLEDKGRYTEVSKAMYLRMRDWEVATWAVWLASLPAAVVATWGDRGKRPPRPTERDDLAELERLEELHGDK